jgi:hypothetical protein
MEKMAKTDTLAQLLSLIGGAGQGITRNADGGQNFSATGMAGGLGNAMIDNKSTKLQQQAMEQTMERQKWEFEQQKERSVTQKKLDAMELQRQQEIRKMESSKMQEEATARDKARLGRAMETGSSLVGIPQESDMYAPGKDANGNPIVQETPTGKMWKQYQQDPKAMLEGAKVPFQKGGTVPALNQTNIAGPMGFVFSAMHPTRKTVEQKTAFALRGPDNQLLTEGLSLSSLNDLNDLALSKPEMFSQADRAKILMTKNQVVQTDLQLSAMSKESNAKAIQAGILTPEPWRVIILRM